MVEANQSTFEREVLEASRQKPVLVDFWAEWCGPCRALGPILERVEQSYGGRFKLVKVNSDENPELSQQFNVRSIPYVLAFVDGGPVDGFVGALPEGQVRQFLDRLLPGPGEIERRKAAKLIDAGDLDGAAAALRAALTLEAQNDAAKLDLADLLLNRLPAHPDDQQLAEAQRALSSTGAGTQAEARWRALDLRLTSLRSSSVLPDVESLRARVAANPADLTGRMELAQRYIADRKLAAALDELLEVIKKDRKEQGEAARRIFLSTLDLAADRPELVSDYRKRLARVLL